LIAEGADNPGGMSSHNLNLLTVGADSDIRSDWIAAKLGVHLILDRQILAAVY
jgi:hypothetical protein